MLEYCQGNVILTGKRFVQFEFGNRRTDHIKDIALNLSARIRQSIKCFVGGILNDAILDRYRNVDEDIVFGLGLANNVELLDAETQLEQPSYFLRRRSPQKCEHEPIRVRENK